jgi:hypothetical protein
MKKNLLTAVAMALTVGHSPASTATDGAVPGRIVVEHRGGPFLPGADQRLALFPGNHELEDRFSEETIVRMAYGALEESIRRSAHVVSFSLRDFRTYYRRDFGSLLVGNVVTLDAPRRLEVRRTEVVGVDGASVGRAYTPRWHEQRTVDDLAELRAFMGHYREFTVAQALAHPDATDEMRRILAVTSYEVTAEFEGERQTYRAAFKWIPTAGDGVSFIVEDHVTDGVDRSLLESADVAPLAVLLDRGRARPREETMEGWR